MSRPTLARLVVATVILVGPAVPSPAQAQSLQAGIQVVPNLRYGGRSAGLLDLYLPRGAKKPTPVILWVHGGGWEAGSKDNPPAIFLVGRGYAVASVGYRLSYTGRFPAQIYDCKAAVRWLRANAKKYNLDPERFGAWGASAGGHLVALLGTSGGVKALEGNIGNERDQSSRVQAVCDWCGPTDLEEFARYVCDAPGLPNDYPRQAVAKLLGVTFPKAKELARAANPITHVTAQCPPFLIMHGGKDTLVPQEQSQLLADALKAAGVEVDLHIVPGSGHDIRGAENLLPVEEFFNEHLRVAEDEAPAEPKVVATYVHKAGTAPPRDIEFYSNGYIDSPSGPHTWILRQKVLLMYWYDTRPSGGMWIDRCTLSADGSVYVGQNQQRIAVAGQKKPQR